MIFWRSSFISSLHFLCFPVEVCLRSSKLCDQCYYLYSVSQINSRDLKTEIILTGTQKSIWKNIWWKSKIVLWNRYNSNLNRTEIRPNTLLVVQYIWSVNYKIQCKTLGRIGLKIRKGLRKGKPKSLSDFWFFPSIFTFVCAALSLSSYLDLSINFSQAKFLFLFFFSIFNLNPILLLGLSGLSRISKYFN